jgi:hypothetical protein
MTNADPKPPDTEHVAFNYRNQPVELHLPGGLIVLPPRGRATLAQADLASPQLRVLEASRVIGVREIPVPPPLKPPETQAPKQADKAQPADNKAGKN